MNVAIRVDASQHMGTGHLARCLTLATELRRQGCHVLFICRQTTEYMHFQIRDKGHEIALLPHRIEAPDADLAHSSWLGVPQEVDAIDTMEILQRRPPLEWLVVDHYGLDARWETMVRPITSKLFAIDDIADRPHQADLLLDQNLQKCGIDRYAKLVPNTCRRLIGPRFALLRPEFREARNKLTQDPRKSNLNVFFGGTDPGGATQKILDVLAAIPSRTFSVDVVAGKDNGRLGEIKRRCAALADTALHVQPASIAALFSEAMLAMGAGGATSWERCCVGLPTIIISIAQNQREGSEALAAARAAIFAGSLDEISPARLVDLLNRLIERPKLLAAIGRRAFALVDGRGAERVAICLMRNNITLSPASKQDAELTWNWRNDPSTRKYSHDPDPVSQDSHTAWWWNSLKVPTRDLLVACCGPLKVGVLRFDYDRNEALVSIYLDPALTGIGLGTSVLEAGTRWLRTHRPNIEKQRAEILPTNSRSKRSFDMAGYLQTDKMTWIRSMIDA